MRHSSQPACQRKHQHAHEFVGYYESYEK